MKELLVLIPTAIGEVTFPIPSDFPVPAPGGDFYFNFESVIDNPEKWEAVRSLLENDVLTVDRKEADRVFLREGFNPNLVFPEPDEYYPDYEAYWKKAPSTKPLNL